MPHLDTPGQILLDLLDLLYWRQRGKVLSHSQTKNQQRMHFRLELEMPTFTLRNLQLKRLRLVVANRHFDDTIEFKFVPMPRKL
jgi:hypothetical protein